MTGTDQKYGAHPVAWDIYERRIYGAPNERVHRVLWVDEFTPADDLESLLKLARNRKGGLDGRSYTLHVRPLYAEAMDD